MIKSIEDIKKRFGSRGSNTDEVGDRQIACLQHDGDQWLLMITSFIDGNLEVISTQETSDPVNLLRSTEIEEVVCVLSSGTIICRACDLQDGSNLELQSALALQAEALLEQDIPAHRIAVTLLEPANKTSTNQGLIVAWPDGKDSSHQHLPELNSECRYVSDAVAITAIALRTNLAHPLLRLDRDTGGLALCMETETGLAIRATREHVAPGTNGDALWTDAVARALGETALHEGIDLDTTESQVAWVRERMAHGHINGLLISEDQCNQLSRMIKNTSNDVSWWQSWGTCLGAILAYTGSMTNATELFFTPPMAERSRLREFSETLGHKKTAKMILIACIILLAFGPILFASLRLGALSIRYGDIDAQLAASQPLNNTMSMYRTLKNETWPMSKLTSDIVRHAPNGVEIDSFRLIHNKDLQIKGVAVGRGGEAAAYMLIQTFGSNLVASKIFKDFKISKDPEGSGGTYTFEISCKVANPYTIAKYEPGDSTDWTDNNTLRHRKFGMPSSDEENETIATTTASPAQPTTTEPPIANEQDQEDTEIAARLDRGRNTSSGFARDGATSRVGGGDTSARSTGTIPPAVTEEQLKSMSQDELQQILREVMNARRSSKKDPELDKRLKDEQRLIFEYLQKKKTGGS